MLTSLHRHKPHFYKKIAPLLNKRLKASDIKAEASSFIELVTNRSNTDFYYEFGYPKSLFIDTNCKELERQLSILTKHANLQFISTYNRFNTLLFCKHLYTPHSVQEIQQIILDTSKACRKIRVLGSKQSYNDIFASDDSCISMDNLEEILSLNENQVTVMAGCKLVDLLLFLYKQDRDLEFMPSNIEGTIGGLLSTAAHGHSRYGTVFSQLVTYMECIDGNGNKLCIDTEEDLKIFRSSAGMLGIITKVRLRTVPKQAHAYQFHYNYLEYTTWLQEIKTRMCAYDHVRYYWISSDPQYISMDYIHPIEVPDTTLATLSNEINYLTFNNSYKKLSKSKKLAIKILPKILQSKLGIRYSFYFFQKTIKNKISAFKTPLFCNFFSKHHYFIRTVAHEYGNVGEWAIPIENAPVFLKDIESLFNAHYEDLNGLALMFRYCGKNDSVLLSASYNREILYIEIKTNFAKNNAARIHELSEEITKLGKKNGVQYHLAKQNRTEPFANNLDPHTLELFNSYRAAVDPKNIFSNEWTKYNFGY